MDIIQNQYFSSIIGQENAKKVLSFHLDIQRITGILPNFLIVGGFGLGKNKIAELFSSNILTEDRKTRPFVIVSCPTIEGKLDFWDEIIVPYTQKEQGYTIILDEAHKIPDDVQTMLLNILNPNEKHENTYIFNGATYTFSFKKSNFIFLTSEPDKLLVPLVNRLVRVELETYNLEQISQIIINYVKPLKFESNILMDVASVCRKNARQAIKLSEDIKNYTKINNLKSFSDEHWTDFKNRLSIQPLGLNSIEVKILKTLEERKALSLTGLGAILGSSPQSLRVFYENYLLSEGLINIYAVKGRMLSNRGKEIVGNLK